MGSYTAYSGRGRTTGTKRGRSISRGRSRSRTAPRAKRSRAPTRSRSRFASRTKTKLFQKASPNVPGMAGAGTFTTFSTRKKMTKWLMGLKKNGASTTVQYNGSGSISASSGAQAIGNVIQVYHAGDVQANINAVIPSATNFATQKVVLETAQVVSYFTNQTTAPISMTVYDVMARRDMPQSTPDSYANNPISLWEQGMIQQGAGGLSVNVGGTPFQSPLMCQAWQIKKVSKIQLPQGGTHEHRVHLDVNRTINYALTNFGDEYFKNLTYFQIYVIHGFPVNSGSFPRQVSTSTAEVDFVTTVKYLVTAISDAESNCKYADNLATLSPQNIVNIGSGAVTTLATA
nr:MAG: capsid protein [Cressdnaviricota sp.]